MESVYIILILVVLVIIFLLTRYASYKEGFLCGVDSGRDNGHEDILTALEKFIEIDGGKSIGKVATESLEKWISAQRSEE